MMILSIDVLSQRIIDLNNDTLAFVDSIGIITDRSGQYLGEFSSNGEILDETDNLLGFIEGSEFKDPSGHVIGSIDANHIVYDINNMVIGSIDGAFVKDANNMTIGSISSAIDEKKVTAFFFFFFTH